MEIPILRSIPQLILFSGLCIGAVPSSVSADEPAQPTMKLEAAEPTTVVAKVADEPITLADVDTEVSQNPGFAFALALHKQRGGVPPTGTSNDMRREGLRTLIDKRLIEKDAFEIGAITKEELESKVQSALAAQQGQSQQMEALFSALKVSGATIGPQIRRQLLHAAYIKKIAADSENVSDEELRRYFEENRDRFDAAHPGMVVPPPPLTFESVRDRVRADFIQADQTKRLDERLDELRAKTKVEIFVAELRDSTSAPAVRIGAMNP